MQVENLRMPPTPARVRVFAPSDLHVTLGFLGRVQEAEAAKAWALIDKYPAFRSVIGSFSRVVPLGNPRKPSALSAMIDEGRDAFSEMIAQARGPMLAAAGAPEDTRPPLPWNAGRRSGGRRAFMLKERRSPRGRLPSTPGLTIAKNACFRSLRSTTSHLEATEGNPIGRCRGANCALPLLPCRNAWSERGIFFPNRVQCRR